MIQYWRNEAGLKGSRPDLSIEALVARIHFNLSYEMFHTVEEVAALYAEVIANGHVFNDGNKRTALTCMLHFLLFNDFKLQVEQDQLADSIVDLSTDKINYKQFAIWLKPKLVKID